MAKAKKKKPAPKAKLAKAKKAAPTKSKKSAVKAKAVKTKPVKSKKAVAAKPTTKKTSLGKITTTSVKAIDYSKVVTPLGDRLVVRIVSAERMTAGGLYIPDNASSVQGHLKGEVLAAGTGNRNKKGQKRPLDVSIGDTVYFNEHSTTKVKLGLEELHIVKEADVLGVVQ